MAQKKPIDINFAALANGGVTERFSQELTRAVENILDENTKATAARKVVLTVTLKPNEKRTRADMIVDVTSKLQSYEPIATELVMGKSMSGVVAAKEEFDAPLPLDTPLMDAIGGAGAGENVTPMPSRAAL